MSQTDLVLNLRTKGGPSTAGEIAKVQEAFKRLSTDAIATNNATIALAKSLGSSFGEAQKFAKALGLSANEAAKSAQRFQELKAAGLTAEQAFTALNKEIGTTKAQFEQLNQALSDPFDNLNLDGVTDDFARVRAEVEKTTLAQERLAREQEQIGKGYEAIALGAGGLAATIGLLGTNALQTSAKFEGLQAALNNTLGSEGEGVATFQRIQEFASKTPFQVDKLTESFLKLANRGFVPTNEELTRLGDLAASQNKEFDQVAEALLDAEQGEFERLKELGISARTEGDKVAITFKGITQEIEKSPEAIRAAILGFGELDGVSGSLAAQSATLNGQFSNFQDSLDQVNKRAGDFASGGAAALLQAANGLLSGFLDLPAPIQNAVFAMTGFVGILSAATFAIAAYNLAVSSGTIPAVLAAGKQMIAFGTALGGVTISSGTAAAGVTVLKGAMASAIPVAAGLVTALAPLLIVAAGIAAIDFIRTTKGMEDFNDALEQYSDREGALGQQSIDLAGQLQRAAAERNAALESGIELTDAQIAKNDQLKAIAAEQVAALEAEKAAVAALKPETEAQEAAQNNLIASYDRSIAALNGQIDSLNGTKSASAEAAKATDEQTKALERQRDALKELNEQRFDEQERTIDRQIEDEGIARDRALAEETAAIQKANAEEIAAIEKANAAEIAEQEKANAEEIAAIEQQNQAELSALQEQAAENEALVKERFQEQLQRKEEAFNRSQELAAQQFQDKLQADQEAFNQQQNAEREAFEQRLSGQQTAVDRQLQLEFATDDEERARLQAAFDREDAIAKRRAELEAPLIAQREAFEAKQKTDQAAFEEKQRVAEAVFNKAQEGERLAFEQSLLQIKAAQEDQLQALRVANEEAIAALRAQQEADLLPIREQQEAALLQLKEQQETTLQDIREGHERELNRIKIEAADEELRLKRQYEDEARDRETRFKNDQRRLDLENADEIARRLSQARVDAGQVIPGAQVGGRRLGGPIDAGRPYWVGEGPGGRIIPGVSELIVPSRPGYVLSAATAQRIARESLNRFQVPQPAIAVRVVSDASNKLLVSELQGLRKDLKRFSRPEQNFSFAQQPTGNDMNMVLRLMKASL